MKTIIIFVVLVTVLFLSAIMFVVGSLATLNLMFYDPLHRFYIAWITGFVGFIVLVADIEVLRRVVKE
jgi:hypothetical protein